MTIGRLKTRPQFLKVASKGKKWATPGLVLQACRRDVSEAQDGPRFGLTASRKVGGAVRRNRARRRLRAIAERILPSHAAAEYDYVIIARKATAERPFTALIADLEIALKRLDLYRIDDARMSDDRKEPTGR